MNRKTRLKVTLISGLILLVTCYVAISQDMESLAMTCVAGIMTALSSYVWGETKRPSNIYDTREF